MSKNSENIDFSIVWKKIHSELTVEEEDRLQGWLAESKDHKDYFDKVIAFYKNGSQFESETDLAKKAWPGFSKKINAQLPRRKSRPMFFWGAVAASIVLFFAILTILKPALFQEEIPMQVDSSIIPGSEKAILMMDDGSSYNLSSGKALSLEIDGAEISSQGTTLKYNSNKEVVKEVKYNTLVIPRGGQFNLTLADGSRVWLNAGSSLKYPTAFVGKDRVVELTGEAFFEVSRNKEKPFKVLSQGQVVQVLGTSFNISSYQEEGEIYTTLVEGKVNVYLEEVPENPLLLSPNQQSVFIKGQNTIEQRMVDVEEYISWKEGWFYFKDKPLEAIMQDMARWYDVTIKFDNEQAKKLPFTGKVRRYERLEDVLKLLEKTRDIKFKIERRTITIN
ncbi:DUF4974 domain-containing protein [Echinicola marina]|uniref:FecR family protein n=1 Tax=Echinicola marina TaxID=2859768 RepID=UPI001CF65782|nr:FecR domain-containing protein [Echinicola marina]UCS95011.1 DUF4974 domain-containing protein [Echinicola marina]